MSPALLTPRWVDDGVVSLLVSTDDAPYLDPSFVEHFSAALAVIAADTSIRVVILAGEGRHFSAGASRESLIEARAKEGITLYTARLPRDLLALPVPTVAAMAGHAIGGGFALGLWCDLALLAEESLYGANFMALGFTPGMGSTVVLEEALGAPLARELLFTGRLVKGRELKAAGVPLSHAIVPRAEVGHRALAVARELAAVPREAAVLLKASLAGRRRERLDRALADEQANHACLFGDPATRRRIDRSYAGPMGGRAEGEQA